MHQQVATNKVAKIGPYDKSVPKNLTKKDIFLAVLAGTIANESTQRHIGWIVSRTKETTELIAQKLGIE